MTSSLHCIPENSFQSLVICCYYEWGFLYFFYSGALIKLQEKVIEPFRDIFA